MLRLAPSNCTAHLARPPTLGSASPHIYPPCPSKPTTWVLPIQSPASGMSRLERSFSQPWGSPGSLKGAADLPIEAESTLIPSSYFFPCVPLGPHIPYLPQSSSPPMHFTSGTIPIVSPSFVPQCPSTACASDKDAIFTQSVACRFLVAQGARGEYRRDGRRKMKSGGKMKRGSERDRLRVRQRCNLYTINH